MCSRQSAKSVSCKQGYHHAKHSASDDSVMTPESRPALDSEHVRKLQAVIHDRSCLHHVELIRQVSCMMQPLNIECMGRYQGATHAPEMLQHSSRTETTSRAASSVVTMIERELLKRAMPTRMKSRALHDHHGWERRAMTKMSGEVRSAVQHVTCPTKSVGGISCVTQSPVCRAGNEDHFSSSGLFRHSSPLTISDSR